MFKKIALFVVVVIVAAAVFVGWSINSALHGAAASVDAMQVRW